ncbi:hypothetical protein GBAR_LOCUS2283 [Geodia barretti]|uniref:Uncharacterized protein n=1 Tax=Geodia barretti TaxID=519541 RepID=A0AA35QZB4_GEOBA|nr:hypothetical protein GBAR_LOCUS2283 [Geodia barretti]
MPACHRSPPPLKVVHILCKQTIYDYISGHHLCMFCVKIWNTLAVRLGV